MTSTLALYNITTVLTDHFNKASLHFFTVIFHKSKRVLSPLPQLPQDSPRLGLSLSLCLSVSVCLSVSLPLFLSLSMHCLSFNLSVSVNKSFTSEGWLESNPLPS